MIEINRRYKDITQMVENDIEQFEQNRKIGENENQICLLIRNDSINEFIEYVNKSNISLISKIKPSIFETNLLLLKRRASLIEYSAFYGSIQIFKYLYKNNVSLSKSLWNYAIHGRNADIIHLLEEEHFSISNNIFDNCYKESVKCNHADLINYAKSNFTSNEKPKPAMLLKYCIHYFNFIELFDIIYQMNDLKDAFEVDDKNDENQKANILFDLCKYDYFKLFTFLFTNSKANINKITIIQKSFLHMKFLLFDILIKLNFNILIKLYIIILNTISIYIILNIVLNFYVFHEI